MLSLDYSLTHFFISKVDDKPGSNIARLVGTIGKFFHWLTGELRRITFAKSSFGTFVLLFLNVYFSLIRVKK